MIFLTVGHQMPFDRLVKAVDLWAENSNRSDIFAQIGATNYRPRFMEYAQTLDPKEFRDKMENSGAIISHAGTGTILTALVMGKPILVMPRLGRLMETRNDHQVATATHFGNLGKVLVAENESELPQMIEKLVHYNVASQISSYASSELIETISAFIQRHC